MNKRQIIPVLILLLTACSPTPIVVPLTPTTNSNTSGTIPVIPLSEEVIPTTILQLTPTHISVPEPSGTIWLQLFSPQDEAIVNTPQVEVIGSVPARAVVSVNDDILLVGDDQQFKTTVALDEGPNLIEILASDENGNEASLILTVTYEP
jgi:hypothetical protein